jgi:hypothetical protein
MFGTFHRSLKQNLEFGRCLCVADCCTLCIKQWNCVAYTYATDGTKSCFLKDNLLGNHSSPNRVSGVYTGPPRPIPPPPTPVPIARACVAPHDKYPFCDTSLSMEDRITNLISLIELDEIPPLLTARESPRGNISRIGLPEYDWGMNAIHGGESHVPR